MKDDVIKAVSRLRKALKGITAVDGELIPLPSQSGCSADHFFLNLLLPENFKTNYFIEDKQVAFFRSTALTSFRLIRKSFKEKSFESIVISVFQPLDVKEGLRIYRTRIIFEDISDLNTSNFAIRVKGEESRDPKLKAFLSK